MDIGNAFVADESGGQDGLGSTSLLIGPDLSGLIAHIRIINITNDNLVIIDLYKGSAQVSV